MTTSAFAAAERAVAAVDASRGSPPYTLAGIWPLGTSNYEVAIRLYVSLAAKDGPSMVVQLSKAKQNSD